MTPRENAQHAENAAFFALVRLAAPPPWVREPIEPRPYNPAPTRAACARALRVWRSIDRTRAQWLRRRFYYVGYPLK